MNDLATKKLENITQIIRRCERSDEGVIFTERGYFDPQSVLDAIKDIQLRDALGEITKADKFLLQVIGETFTIGATWL